MPQFLREHLDFPGYIAWNMERKYEGVSTEAGEWPLINIYVSEKGVLYDVVSGNTDGSRNGTRFVFAYRENQIRCDVARPDSPYPLQISL